ncbi:MAG: hypothetical protein HYY16_11615 [Planctomycetes bacterium]|nr:hypothetical protein [Planctomycetota bacterium]
MEKCGRYLRALLILIVHAEALCVCRIQPSETPADSRTDLAAHSLLSFDERGRLRVEALAPAGLTMEPALRPTR